MKGGPALATDDEPRRGFDAPCPACGVEETLYVDLDDVLTLRCHDCDTEWSTTDLKRMVARLTAVIAWLETAPARAAADPET